MSAEPIPPPCEGCGGASHGSVGVGRACLVAALRIARAETVAAKKLVARMTARHAHPSQEKP